MKNTLKARAGPLGKVNTVEKKITFNLFEGKIFTWVSNCLFFCWTTPSRSLHSIRLTFSIFTVLYSPLHLKAFCKWVSYVVASEYQMSSEQEHHVKQPVLFLFYSCHLSYRKTLKFSLNTRNRCGGFQFHIPFTKISYPYLFPFSSSNTIQGHVLWPGRLDWLDFFFSKSKWPQENRELRVQYHFNTWQSQTCDFDTWINEKGKSNCMNL